MNPLVRTLILGGLLVVGVGFAVNVHNDKVAGLELDRGHEKLRASFVERAGYVRSLASDDRYRDEFIALLKWYDAQLAELHNLYPGRFDNESAIKELDAQVASGKAKPGDIALKKEFYEHTKGFYTLLETGRYNPVATQVATGLRVDLVQLKREVYEGKPKLRVDLAIWGAPRRELAQKQEGKAANVKMTLDFAVKSLSLEFIDAKQKLVGGGDTGAPVLTIDYPERWVPGFPPQATFGTWWIDPLPQETEKLSLKIDAEIRSPTSGGLPLQFNWDLAARPEWKLGAGETFEGETRLMPEEDLDRSGQK